MKEHEECCYLRLDFQNKKKFKMADQASTSGYKEPQYKKFLTTDEVLTAFFDSENVSDGSEISFDQETISGEEFIDDVPSLVDETKLEESSFQDTLLDVDVSSLFLSFA